MFYLLTNWRHRQVRLTNYFVRHWVISNFLDQSFAETKDWDQTAQLWSQLESSLTNHCNPSSLTSSATHCADFAVFLCLFLNYRKSEVIFAHQNLISNRLIYLVHAKSTGELISFGFSDRSLRSLVSANRSAKTLTSLFGWSLVSIRI